MKRTFLVLSAAVLQFGVAKCTQADTFNYSGSIAQFTVPSTGIYNITASGAQGGDSGGGGTGGKGFTIDGDISLTAGMVLDIVVGGQGSNGESEDFFFGGGGGGGGSFVYVDSASSPLLVAGGGGGGGFEPSSDADGGGGRPPEDGQAGFGADGGAGGTDGSGGGAGTSQEVDGAGGAGWAGNGGSASATEDYASNPAGGGLSEPTFAGGVGDSRNFGELSANGGFGGGGGGDFGGGGGGGYSGGGGGADILGDTSGGGGGGSYVDSSFIDYSFDYGANSGNGLVTITALTTVPAPASAAGISVLLAGLAGLRFSRRRCATA